jgi:hypothetical protein
MQITLKRTDCFLCLSFAEVCLCNCCVGNWVGALYTLGNTECTFLIDYLGLSFDVSQKGLVRFTYLISILSQCSFNQVKRG